MKTKLGMALRTKDGVIHIPYLTPRFLTVCSLRNVEYDIVVPDETSPVTCPDCIAIGEYLKRISYHYRREKLKVEGGVA